MSSILSETADHREMSGGYKHFLVLAENEAGYRNLVRLTSEAALHGFYRKPRVSKDFLARHTEGLIGFLRLSGGRGQSAPDGREVRRGEAYGREFEEMFGKGNFFLEVQDHGLEPDKGVCDALSSRWSANLTFR